MDEIKINNAKNNLEIEERKVWESDKSLYNHLYPNLNDPYFNKKIAEKKEFNDTKYNGKIVNIEKEAYRLCNSEFELSPHQQFVKNFLSLHTPYNSLLLFHGLGTGKTCSAIGVAEEMRNYIKQINLNKRIIIVASPNVQANFKLQLFDESKLKLINGLWNIQNCTGNKLLREINPVNMKNLSKKDVVYKIEQLIKKSYIFMGYIEFAGYIKKLSNVDTDNKNASRIIKKRLNNKFRDRLLIIDEVHNIRSSLENTKKRVASELLKLVKNVSNMKLLLLSATPMYNDFSFPPLINPSSSRAKANGTNPPSKYCEYTKITPFDFIILLHIFSILLLYLPILSGENIRPYLSSLYS